ncbi:MAG: hypothetical protein EA376_04235 [Phycisphaeraceae bacterium]|nr:MAG: hypothetical protein EA376_04235 [Phycisphaeraceae bacterium]
MIVRVTGVLERVDGNAAVVAIEAAGVAHEVLLPRFLAEKLTSDTGAPITLHTIELLEAHNQGASFTPRLIGFATAGDRRFFELFTTVKGIGTRKALRAMAAPIPEIAGAIARRDTSALQKLPEIGKRMAETIVAELSGKVDAFLGSAESQVVEPKTGAAASPAGEQAISALVRLGESRADAERMVQRALASGADPQTPDAILAAAYATRES